MAGLSLINNYKSDKMECDQAVSKKNAHHWDFEMSFSCASGYDHFINWLRDEFYFFQQDQELFLTIYFPNGQVHVKKEFVKGDTLLSKITIESKCRKVGLRIQKKLSEFLNHREVYHKLSQI